MPLNSMAVPRADGALVGGPNRVVGVHATGSRLSKYNLGPATTRHTPHHIIYVVGRFLRLVSVYASFKYLAGGNVSISIFMFTCVLVSGLVFLIFQRPWHGRPLSSSQIVPTVLNGGVLALALVCWGKSLVACGPVRTVLAEYTGAVLGAASTFALGRGGHKWKKVGGLVAMLAAFYFLSEGWAMASFSPFSSGTSNDLSSEEGRVGPVLMSMSVIAGALLALRRVIARRVSMKNQSKKRLHALTVTSAACFLFPVAMFQWAMGDSSGKAEQELHGFSTLAYLSTIVFGIVMAFYVDTYAEDRLHIHASSPMHLLVTAGCLILLEFLHHMDFSLVGFVICCSILGLGIFEATSSERLQPSLSSLPYDSTDDVLKLHHGPATFSSVPP